jgi:ribosomal protein S13
MLKGVFLAFCLLGMLAIPVAAAPDGQAMHAQGQAIEQKLKDDLWNNHQTYRLQRYDMNVQQAKSVIVILETYGIDTTKCKATLSTIESKRAALQTALTDKDKEQLQTINAELRTLWQQFRTEVRESIKAKYGITRSVMKNTVSGTMRSGSLS